MEKKREPTIGAVVNRVRRYAKARHSGELMENLEHDFLESAEHVREKQTDGKGKRQFLTISVTCTSTSLPGISCLLIPSMQISQRLSHLGRGIRQEMSLTGFMRRVCGGFRSRGPLRSLTGR